MATAHAALSEPLRELLDLVVMDGLTTREAAQALGISSTTARVRLHRARKALQAAGRTPNKSREAVLEASQ